MHKDWTTALWFCHSLVFGRNIVTREWPTTTGHMRIAYYHRLIYICSYISIWADKQTIPILLMHRIRRHYPYIYIYILYMYKYSYPYSTLLSTSWGRVRRSKLTFRRIRHSLICMNPYQHHACVACAHVSAVVRVSGGRTCQPGLFPTATTTTTSLLRFPLCRTIYMRNVLIASKHTNTLSQTHAHTGKHMDRRHVCK